MALQKEFTTAQGFHAPSAYARITHFSGTKDVLQVNVEVHKDLAARELELQPIAQYTLSLPLTHGATMSDMYAAIKLDSNFLDATDC